MKSYVDAPNKREVQKVTLKPWNKSIIGLAGPNADVYEKSLKDLGFSNITLYENNLSVYHSLVDKKLTSPLYCDDILKHMGENAVYDFDFCCTIKKIEKYLPNILKTKHFSLTVALRGIGYEQTISTFKKYGEAYFVKYRDSSPMVTFFR